MNFMNWKHFKEFIAEDWNEHGGCASMFAAALLFICSFAIYCLIASLANHGVTVK